jgi:hypothetical protein
MQVCSTFSFRELIQISSGIAKSHVNKTNDLLMKLLRDICINKFTLQDGPDQMMEKIQSAFRTYTKVEELTNAFEQTLPLLPEEIKVEEDLGEKRLTRQNVKGFFEQEFNITKSKTYYLIAHLTQADLSMLSDFDEIKEELSIVNGSFVTLGKPFKYCGRNIHIRDTMLLAPGGSKSLASVGKLYGEGLKKIEISKSEIEDMEGFLTRDKVKFSEYAIRDALISLVHAS